MSDDSDESRWDRPTVSRRSVLATFGAISGIAGLAAGQNGGQQRLEAGSMSLSNATRIAGTDIWIGPDSGKANVDPSEGRKYEAVDSQVDYYGDGSSWNKMGIGSSQEPVPSVNTDDASFKGEPWHDVTRYGAVGDGSTDDSQAIEDAMGTDSDFRVVYLPTPSDGYLIDSEVTVPSNTAIITPQPYYGATLYAGTNLSSSEAVLRNTSGFENIYIYGLEIDGTNGWDGEPYSASEKCLFFRPGATNDGTKNLVVEFNYCHDSPATAIGCDSIINQHYRYNWVENAGTDGQSQGGNGIGIGAGEVTGSCPTWIVGNYVKDTAEFGIILEQTGDTEISWGYHINGNTVNDARVGIAGEQVRGVSAIDNSIIASSRMDHGMLWDALDNTFGVKQVHVDGVHFLDPGAENANSTESPDVATFEFGTDATFCTAEGFTMPTGSGYNDPQNNGSFCAIEGIGREAAGSGNTPTWTDRWENISCSQVRNTDDSTVYVPDQTGGWDQIV